MNQTEYDYKQKNGIERSALIVFTIYVAIICSMGFRVAWPVWVPVVIMVACFSGWLMFLLHYRSYEVRTLLMSIIIMLSFLLYGINSTSFEAILPTFMVLTLLVAYYAHAEYLYISVFAIVVVMLNFLILHNGDEIALQNAGVLSRQMGNVLFFEWLLIFWVAKRQEATKFSRTMLEAQKRAERSKDDFLANISHEIRTPLNTISGMSEMVMQENDIEKIKENVYMIQAAGRNLMSTVNDILDFTELQSGAMFVEEENYNISSTLQDIVNMAVAMKGEKKIELIVNMDPNLPRVLYGDIKKIRRVVMNLLSNAIKFTESGYVGISVSAREENYGVNLSFTISDSGIGMKEENVEKLFTSFSQIDTRRNRQEGGLGLGLAISREIAQKLGGVITLRSIEGKGSVLTLVVPQKVVEPEPSVALSEMDNYKLLCYINMEQFGMREIRDAYQANIMQMIDQAGVNCVFCRNLEEFKRRVSNGSYQFAFITLVEYEEDKVFFDRLAEKMGIIVVLEHRDEAKLTNPKIYKQFKPFYILPVANFANQVAGGLVQTQHERFIAPTARVLVVDDNRMNIRVIEGLLSQYEIQVISATSGAEALEKIEQKNFDFVFMDHMMPEMDGVETAHRIRSKVGTYYQTVPIIALTANAVAGSRRMFLEEGFADFLEKPVESSVLARVLHRNIPIEKQILVSQDATQKTPNYTEKQPKEETSAKPSDKKAEDISDAMQQNTTGKTEDEFTMPGIDVKKGMAYCGGKQNYLEILKECCEEYLEKSDELSTLFANQDWKNYGIKVHALKGIMRSIGADEVGEFAYKLETAAKSQAYGLIAEQHPSLMEMYKNTIVNIVVNPLVDVTEECMRPKEEVAESEQIEDTTQYKVLSLADLTSVVKDFESAMYELDSARMEALLAQIDESICGGIILKKQTASIHKKISQADYFSAGDMLSNLLETVTEKGGQ